MLPTSVRRSRSLRRRLSLKTRFLHESGLYGELETGTTALAFVAHEVGAGNFPGGYARADKPALPLGVEVVLVTETLAAAYKQAVAAGAVSLSQPEEKPWGQVVSYVRCPDGTLVELCTPMG